MRAMPVTISSPAWGITSQKSELSTSRAITWRTS